MDYVFTSSGCLVPADALCHYGVKGQKWGIRRYQNKDGSLTPEGRKRAKREYKADNKKAYELGKSATITGHAAAQSMNRTIKLENKLDKRYAKDPEGAKRGTKTLRKKWEASAKTTAQLTEDYVKYKTAAESHCKSLVDKYGKEAVSSIKYRDVKLRKGDYSPSKFNTIDERTNNLSDYTAAGIQTMAVRSFLAMMGSPVSVAYIPKSTHQKAYELETVTYYKNRRHGN